MTKKEQIIKYCAMALAILLAVGIVVGTISAIGRIFGLFSGDNIGDNKTYSISDSIENLNININSANFTLQTGDKFSVESNLKYLKVDEDGDTLIIKETIKAGVASADAALTITVPEGTEFDRVKIDTGAGVVNFDTLTADKITMSFGAGEVRISSLTAKSGADIDGGAGRITIRGGAIHDLDFDMGVGEFNLTSRLSGDCDLDLGVGQSNITLIGAADDYEIDADKGIGEIKIGGMTISSSTKIGNGNCEVEISGGVGSIIISFSED